MSETLWKIAQQLCVKGKNNEIVTLFDEASQSRPLSPDEAHYYGRALLETGNPEKSLPFLVLADAHCSEGFWASLYLARALAATGQPDESMDALTRAVERGGSSRFYVSVLLEDLNKAFS